MPKKKTRTRRARPAGKTAAAPRRASGAKVESAPSAERNGASHAQTQRIFEPAEIAYVQRLAAALTDLGGAQATWVAALQDAVGSPQLLKDETWQARANAAVGAMLRAAGEMRVSPLPESMAKVDATLAKAHDRVRLLAQRYDKVLAAADPTLIKSLSQHVDAMLRYIRDARSQLTSG